MTSNRALQDLYENRPRLNPAYIRDVLRLKGKRADLVGEITGGISRDEADLLTRVVRMEAPVRTLEVGLGYGFSALAICEAADGSAPGRRHVVIDPHQTEHWGGQGLENLIRAGHGDYLELYEAPSFRVLPELEREGVEIDLAFVDGWHTFDFVFVDFFYIDRLLRRGGVVAFDDADWPSVRTVLRYVVTNLAYEVCGTLPEKQQRMTVDQELGLEGSLIALRKGRADLERDIFYHRPFQA